MSRTYSAFALSGGQTSATTRVLARLVLLALACATFASSSLAQEERVALVIGNANYESAPLLTPVNDAQLMAQTLKSLGFEVTLRTDQTQKQMKRLIRDFGERLERSKGIGLFYYSGHGMAVGGQNYMIPIATTIKRESDVDIEAVKTGNVLAAMYFARANVNIVILDACRDNPFAKSFKAYTKGLARMDSPPGTLIAYATAPGDVAIAGEGKYSPYTEALVEQIKAPNVPIEQVMKQTRRAVSKKTDGRQIPWEASSLIEDFYFNQTAVVMPRPQEPGLYLTTAGRSARRVTASMLRAAPDDLGRKPDDGARPYSFSRDVRGACFVRNLLAGHRLSWDDFGLCESFIRE